MINPSNHLICSWISFFFQDSSLPFPSKTPKFKKNSCAVWLWLGFWKCCLVPFVYLCRGEISYSPEQVPLHRWLLAAKHLSAQCIPKTRALEHQCTDGGTRTQEMAFYTGKKMGKNQQLSNVKNNKQKLYCRYFVIFWDGLLLSNHHLFEHPTWYKTELGIKFKNEEKNFKSN